MAYQKNGTKDEIYEVSDKNLKDLDEELTVLKLSDNSVTAQKKSKLLNIKERLVI